MPAKRNVPSRPRHKLWLALSATLLVLGVACGSAATSASPTPAPPTNTPASAPETTSTPGPAPTGTPNAIEQPAADTKRIVDIAAVPMVNTSIASVPLNDIVFDTFGRSLARFVPLDRATEEFILELRDAIVPIYQPAYGVGEDLPWLSDDDLVIGYVSGDEAYAYPINILDFHELINDEIGGIPVLITYCPLCASGVVYSRVLDGETLLFGNTSALYQSDLVMYDHQTGSYWFQTGGEAVVGSLTGAHLDLLPSTTMSWGEWKKLHPETQVLTGTIGSPTRFSSPRYHGGIFSGYQDRVNEDDFAFPVDSDKLDNRLLSGELVLTVEVGDAVTAYPLERIGDAAVNDWVGGEPVVVFSRENSRAAGAFSREVEGQVLTFDYRAHDDSFVDQETGSLWDAAGRATSGPLVGAQLERMNTRRAFWFSIVIAFPEVNLYLPDSK